MSAKPFDVEAELRWIKEVDGKMGGLDWDEGIGYVAGQCVTNAQWDMVERVVKIVLNLASQIRTLREENSRMRKALAGLVSPDNPADMDRVEIIDAMAVGIRAIGVGNIGEAEALAALDVLKATRPKEAPSV